MPVATLNKALPALPDGLNRLTALNDLKIIWDMLRRLPAARAPSGGANLPGGSDDVFLSQWARVLALIGPPSSDPHTGYESARLDDIQDSVWWLSYFVAAAINIVPELTPRYALGR
jgi:hypothetical protein